MDSCNRILFVNTNIYKKPPVIPIGIEYLVHALKENGFETHVLDLCFSDDPLGELEQICGYFKPHAVCATVRNADSVLYPETDFFLSEIRTYIRKIKEVTNAPIIIGGSALSADPEGITKFLEAHAAISGPGEKTLPRVLKEGRFVTKEGNVLMGELPETHRNEWSFRPGRAEIIDFSPYVKEGGLAGFETHKGCTSNCVYCMEAGSKLCFRDPNDVVYELDLLVKKGLRHLHLCDSEFNEDLHYCKKLLNLMIRENLDIQWVLYMKPGTYDRNMFELLNRSGAYLITLSVDTFRRSEEYWNTIAEMVSIARDHDIKTSIDLIAGFPYEDKGTLQNVLGFFRELRPHEVVVNTYIRLYKNLPVTHMIEGDGGLWKYLINEQNGSYLMPVFYNHISAKQLRELIGEGELFRIAGEEKVVNYQKASK